MYRALRDAKSIGARTSTRTFAVVLVVRGTRIPVHMLSDLAKAGETRARLLEDYPVLDEELLDAALLYASLYPRRGRPKGAVAGAEAASHVQRN